jgi:pimeloyl-ACP methyl ester carboxylesterase
VGPRSPSGPPPASLARPVPLLGGGTDVYILQARYWQQVAADVPEAEAIRMAATQRPIMGGALAEPAQSQSWRTLPSWFVWGSLDRNIPAALHAFMAHRSGAREAVEVPGASHVVMISHPDIVARMIERAAEVE